MSELTCERDPVARAIDLLVQSSRVSPALREAVATVESELKRLTAERDAYQSALEHASQGLRDLLDANADREHEGMSRDDWDAAILKAEDALDTAHAALEDPLGEGWSTLVVTVPARAALEADDER